MNEGLELTELVDMILSWWGEGHCDAPDFVVHAQHLKDEMEKM